MASSFVELLSDSVGKQIRMQRHGPEMAAGTLCFCGDDYVVLRDEVGQFVLYPGGSIQAFGTITEPKPVENRRDGKDGKENREPTDINDDPNVFKFDTETSIDFKECSHFYDVLTSVPKMIVQIGKDGPDKVRGLILDVADDYVSMISDVREIIYIPMWAIKCLVLNPGKKSDSNSSSSSGGFAWFK